MLNLFFFPFTNPIYNTMGTGVILQNNTLATSSSLETLKHLTQVIWKSLERQKKHNVPRHFQDCVCVCNEKDNNPSVKEIIYPME